MTLNKVVKYKGRGLGARHVQAILLFFCILVNTIDRLKTAVAVFAMTDAASTNISFEQFKWNKIEKGYILSSFYWGQVMTQFIGSFVCRKLGAKLTILISTLGSAILNILTPLCITSGGWQMYTAISIAQGMFQGLCMPGVHEHIAKWTPIEERIRLGAFSNSGMEMGTILAMGVPGLIAQTSLGWPGISYVSGGMSIAWCLFWALFADNSPTVSRFICSEEKQFILASQQKIDDQLRKIPVPWKAICTSGPFLSLIIIESAQSLGFKTIQNEIPSYFHGILHMDVKSNALFSALPYIVMFVVANVFLFFGDLNQRKNTMSLTAYRKLVSTLSTWIPAVTMVLIGFLDEKHKTFALILIIVSVGLSGGRTIGSGLNCIDLSDNHAATLMGINTTACSITFIITPLFVAGIVRDGTDRSEWQIVFAIAALILFVSNLQYIIFGRTNAQPWNDENFGVTSMTSTLSENEERIGQNNTEDQFKCETSKEGYINHRFVYCIHDDK